LSQPSAMLISTNYASIRFLGTIVSIGIWFLYAFIFVSIFCTSYMFTIFIHSLIVHNDHTFLYMQ
jgi:hypothetical protein